MAAKASEKPDDPATEIALKRVLLNPKAPPIVANHFLWTRVGQEYVVEVGYYDLFEVRSALKKAKTVQESEPPTVDFFVTHRFAVGLDSIERVLGAFRGMQDQWQKAQEIGKETH